MTVENVRELKLWRDPEVLWELRIEREWPATKIAAELGCSRVNVHTWLRRRLLKVDRYADAPWRDFETLWDLHVERGMRIVDIAEMLGCHESTVSVWLRRNYIEPIGERNGSPKINDRLSEDLDEFPPCPECEKNLTGMLTSRRRRHGHADQDPHYICEACDFGWEVYGNGEVVEVSVPFRIAQLREAGVVSRHA